MQLSPDGDDPLSSLYADIAEYYTGKLAAYGASPLGVDWTCEPTQALRFIQLLRICDFSTPFSLNDIGCGYGALLGLLRTRYRRTRVDYAGVDISDAMVQMARQLWQGRQDASFYMGSGSPRVADYSIASGIFNVKQSATDKNWEELIARTLSDMHANSRLGFAVNFLDLAAPGMNVIPELYRVSPVIWTSYCSTELLAQVEVLGNYGMNEFTLLVKRRAK